MIPRPARPDYEMTMRQEIERAVFHSRLEDFLAVTGECHRLYLGHEFCQRLLPTATEVRRARDYAAARGVAFTLVTPFVTDAGLERVRLLVEALRDGAAPDFEVVVNDWGVLRWLHRTHPALPLALGRLLVKQKRGPQILTVADRLPPAALDHFRRCNADVPHLRRFLEEMGVRRLELDNLLQGISRGDGLPASLYHPWAYITTTRLCLLMRGDRPDKNPRSLGVCHRECRHYGATIRHRDIAVPVAIAGNTQFFRNDRLPEDLAALNITRLVYQPQIP